MKSYQWNAMDYQESSKAQKKWADELLTKLQLNGDESILDVGCGDGKITAELSQKVKKGSVVGIDSSSEMVQLAQKNFNADNLEFIHMDVRKLALDRSFDVIFSNACLHWIVDHLLVLKNFSQYLKPGGCILLQMGGKGNASDIIHEVDVMISDYPYQSYFKEFQFPYGFYDTDQYQMWLKEVGFNIHEVKLIPKDMVHENSEALAGWFRTTWLPYLERLPEHLRNNFINEIIHNYLEKYPVDDEGRTHVKMIRLEVNACKS